MLKTINCSCSRLKSIEFTVLVLKTSLPVRCLKSIEFTVLVLKTSLPVRCLKSIEFTVLVLKTSLPVTCLKSIEFTVLVLKTSLPVPCLKSIELLFLFEDSEETFLLVNHSQVIPLRKPKQKSKLHELTPFLYPT